MPSSIDCLVLYIPLALKDLTPTHLSSYPRLRVHRFICWFMFMILLLQVIIWGLLITLFRVLVRLLPFKTWELSHTSLVLLVNYCGTDLFLSQEHYILDILQHADLTNAKPASTPFPTGTSLTLGDNALFENPVRYRQTVGSLQYVTLSRPDITYVVNKVCQFMHSPTVNH